MISERTLQRLEELKDNEGISRALAMLQDGYRALFMEVLDDEFTHDELVEIGEVQLDIVYDEFGASMASMTVEEYKKIPVEAGETYHPVENPYEDWDIGRSPENPL